MRPRRVLGRDIPVGTGEGYTGYPARVRLLEEGTYDSGAGPGRPCRGLEWVVICSRTYGPVYAALGPPTPALWASGARSAVPGLLGAGPGADGQKGEIP